MFGAQDAGVGGDSMTYFVAFIVVMAVGLYALTGS
jgi:hypothetical protein